MLYLSIYAFSLKFRNQICSFCAHLDIEYVVHPDDLPGSGLEALVSVATIHHNSVGDRHLLQKTQTVCTVLGLKIRISSNQNFLHSVVFKIIFLGQEWEKLLQILNG